MTLLVQNFSLILRVKEFW